MTLTEMLTAYRTLTAAHAYILGFTHNGRLYSAELPELPESALGLTRTSSRRGGVQKIRIRLRTAEKLDLIARGARDLGPADLLEAEGHNRGENFERIVTEAAGQSWVKDSTPFWVAGDITLNGQEVQIKLDGAELTNERALARALS